jgi:eukaryotic-like serine/threonine-protein kinase
MVPVAEQVPFSTNTGFGAFSVSSTGTLAYRLGNGTTRELAWNDRAGKRIAAITKVGNVVLFPTISPDQRTVAFSVNTGTQSDIWLQDTTREVISRFSFRPGINRSPVWAPDGKLVAFSHQEATAYSFDIFVKSSAGGGAEELLLKAGVNAFMLDWSPDGQRILYQQLSDKTGSDLWLLPVTGDRKPVAFLQTPADEQNGKFAPTLAGGPQWVAYQSNESGLNQIYVQSIPANGAKYQISTAGGTQPIWRGDGKELFYLSPDRKLMAVAVTVGATVVAGTPQELFTDTGMTGFTASKDGQRFLIVVPVGGENAATPITVVLDWALGLKK